MNRIERILLVVLGTIAVSILAGTAWALATGAPSRKAAREAIPTELAAGGVYDGIGRIRAKTSDGAVVVAHVAFPYDASERAFGDELRQRRTDLRALAIGFFSSMSAESLGPAAEGAVKAGLRDILNGALSLGSIDELYLAEFRVIP